MADELDTTLCDKEKTAFVCHKGLFEFNVLPFGLNSGPGLFSELVTEVLQGLVKLIRGSAVFVNPGINLL
jgi:hypothetical protein